METKHTPGPWKVVYDLRQYWPYSGEHELVGYDIESESGQQVIGCEGIEAWKDAAEANARLIAAAPDLLAALQELRYACTDKAEAMADEAISKAIGA